MSVRTRRMSFFQQPPLFDRSTRNFYLFPAIAFALLIAIFFLYVPKFQEKLGTVSEPAARYCFSLC
jgi:sodium/potassium-transporting ATPase subunit alpha